MADVKAGRLLMRWSKRHRDFLYDYPEGGKADGGMLHFYLKFVRDPSDEHFQVYGPGGLGGQHKYPGRSLLDQLDARGYDLTTIRIQIDKKKS